MLEVLFDDQGLIHYEFIPEGHTVNIEMCVEILLLQGYNEKETLEKIGMKQLLSSLRKSSVLIGHW
jgi:hypothetical protein